jgi:hypothetical protein
MAMFDAAKVRSRDIERVEDNPADAHRGVTAEREGGSYRVERRALVGVRRSG